MTGPRIELQNASRWYGNVVAVNAVTCELRAGITGLLGPNGAGKSTVLHLMAGLLAPSDGQVLVDGASAAGHPDMYRTLGLVPERESVHPFLTGYEFVRMNARLQRLADPDASARAAIAMVDMAAAQDRVVSTYSKGMRQRIKIAGAIVHRPTILLLDEPFNGMDPRQRLHMIGLLRTMAAEGCVVLISSHILEELDDLATNVLVMVSGRLAASGHFREIRRLMTDRPHTFTLRSSDDRRLAAALIAEPSVFGVDLTNGGPATSGGLSIRTSDRGAFARALPRRARDAGIRVLELRPTDESLESVFSYLVDR
ncbi:MAG TPA: ABC transporter ATP-binding protein [Gemmatimonadaceae bacterium]|nr:ABC transporter ATP-binding protein [Gemmatimonadaceae bacterium]